jgi:hypothetical protein
VSSKQSNFFSVRTETNRNPICFGCFSVCFVKPKNIFFGLFRCFGSVSKQPKQTQLCRNKPKNIQKTFYIRGVLETDNIFFFSVRTETNRKSICFVCFSVCFLQNQIIFPSVCFGVSDRYQNNRNKQNLRYGELKRVIF